MLRTERADAGAIGQHGRRWGGWWWTEDDAEIVAASRRRIRREGRVHVAEVRLRRGGTWRRTAPSPQPEARIRWEQRGAEIDGEKRFLL